MVKVNWNIFSAKFPDTEKTFEWFSYLLFCKEFNKNKGIEEYFNQAGIETEPIKVGNDFIGFQAKFYSKPLSNYRAEIKNSLDTTKKYYPKLTKYYFYTNTNWGQLKSKSPKVKIVQL